MLVAEALTMSRAGDGSESGITEEKTGFRIQSREVNVTHRLPVGGFVLQLRLADETGIDDADGGM